MPTRVVGNRCTIEYTERPQTHLSIQYGKIKEEAYAWNEFRTSVPRGILTCGDRPVAELLRVQFLEPVRPSDDELHDVALLPLNHAREWRILEKRTERWPLKRIECPARDVVVAKGKADIERSAEPVDVADVNTMHMNLPVCPQVGRYRNQVIVDADCSAVRRKQIAAHLLVGLTVHNRLRLQARLLQAVLRCRRSLFLLCLRPQDVIKLRSLRECSEPGRRAIDR